jgi:hypothetical protein
VPFDGGAHLVEVVDDEAANTTAFYVDGVAKGTASEAVQYASNRMPLIVSGYGSGASLPFTGRAAQVAVIPRALTADERARIWERSRRRFWQT